METVFNFPDPTPFDTRTKQLLTNAIPVLLRLLLHMEPGEPLEWVTQPNEEPLVIHKRADFVVKNLKTGEFLQVELQSKASPDLLRRCFVYAAPYFFHYDVFLHQYILHLGKDAANYPTLYEDSWHRFRIEVIDLKQIPAEELLHTDTPEVVVLAVLCASESADHLIEEILTRLRDLVLDSERLADYISILDTLGELRDLNQIIKNKANHMSLHFDKTKTFLFNDGKAEGVVEGKQLGRDETIIQFVRELYADGDLTLTKIAKLCHLTEDQVREILNLPEN